jgi:hypothetical protein
MRLLLIEDADCIKRVLKLTGTTLYVWYWTLTYLMAKGMLF